MNKNKKAQYQVEINKNTITEETGTFFQALPFTIEYDNTCYTLTFARDKHHVIYIVKKNNTIVDQLQFPDYLPTKNTDLNLKERNLLSHALAHLNIGAKQKKQNKTDSELSYTITQLPPNF